MSNGALTQLVAVGAQDTNFLSNDIKDSLFQESNKKITNFAKSTETMIAQGNANWGNTIKFKIEKKGDLLSSMYLAVELPDVYPYHFDESLRDSSNYFRWSNYIGNLLVENIKFFINGQLIDEQTGEFQQIYTDLYDDDWNKLCMLGMDGNLTIPYSIDGDNIVLESTTLYIPIKFWFCNNISKALPVIALQYSDLEVEVKLRKFDECFLLLQQYNGTIRGTHQDYFVNIKKEHTVNQIDLKNVKLDCNFIYLDSDERKKIAQKEHKILITQTQRIECSVQQSKSIELNFNHPVKEMFFFIRNNNHIEYGEGFNFKNKPEYMPNFVYEIINTNSDLDIHDYYYGGDRHNLDQARILINSHPRVNWHNWKYYYYVQNYENYRNKLEHFVYLYSFGTNVKSLTPSGSLNFSRIDNAQLQIKMSDYSKKIIKPFLPADKSNLLDDSQYTTNIYAVNYNYLIIKGGMAGLEFSN